MKKKYQFMILGAAGATFAAAGINNKLMLKEYTVRSEKITRPVNIVFISDVHSQRFKDGAKKLIDMIGEANPDCVLFGGDIFDKHTKREKDAEAYRLVHSIKSKFGNCFYVCGNHERESGKAEDVSQRFDASGIKNLGGESYILQAYSGQEIIIGGMDYDENDERVIAQRESFAAKAEESGLFSVLVRHVPYFVTEDERFDLILSGHNHGGLWRFPNTDVGVAGGERKLFPKYVHGEYRSGGTSLIVGSGITTSTYLLPRLYNQPEVVKITLQPLRRF